jgi:hypothetical protein
MTTNTNRPNQGNQGETQRTGTPSTSKTPGSWTGSGQEQASRQSSSKQSSGNDATSRYLDAIEENVSKLRDAITGSGRGDRDYREDRDESDSNADRSL